MAASGWNGKIAAEKLHRSTGTISLWLNDKVPADEGSLQLFKKILAEENPGALCGVERGCGSSVKVQSRASSTKGAGMIGLQPEIVGDKLKDELSPEAVEHARNWDALRKVDPEKAKALSYLAKPARPRKKKAAIT